ncbi:helix-turn-helix transcriptional regulator [Caminicella sporogenes]|uniref:helix-turn-helix transcriptional regulator n=1 Tax=Caminicella sporogenes TaxID=166485 RepID=UPI002540B212|nr:helix-turn-helix transcriptional regulator [Caminicella sporogenes]WIF95093.1 helix-turn-helix transcriptional regulator [Caminicella sporogenes]
MNVNKEYVQKLIKEKNWSQNQFARNAGVSKTTASRWLNGKRGAGRRLISGIIKAFPDEPLDKLFFLNELKPNSNKHKRRR